jgi:hypothetical protein
MKDKVTEGNKSELLGQRAKKGRKEKIRDWARVECRGRESKVMVLIVHR